MIGNSEIIAEKKLSWWFYGFSFLHVFFWTVVPTLIRHSLPMDALEGFLWGQSWQLGYDRNPWLNAWLTSLAVKIGGQTGWLVYLFSQLSVFICFWAIWKLGRKILPAIYALIAVLLLEAVQYYTIAAVDFNDNVLELSLWALSMLYFYEAIKEQRIFKWILFGLFAGLSLMAKYYAVILFAAMLVFLLSCEEGRDSFKHQGIYLGMLVFILVISPHFVWLMNHDLATLNYALARVSDHYSWRGIPLYFGIMQFAAFLPSIILFGIFFGKRQRQRLNLYDMKFLLCLGFLPLIFTLAYAFFAHKFLHVMWGTPLLSLWGLILVAFTMPKITLRKFYLFTTLIFIVSVCALAGYSYSILYRSHISSANYPAQKITDYVVNKWQAECRNHHQFAYVAGDRYTVANIAYFMGGKAKACIIEDQINTCPGDNILKAKGAVFVWRMDESHTNKTLLDKVEALKQRTKFAVNKFYWERNCSREPIEIGLAFLQ